MNLYAPHANVYRRADGSAYPLVRNHDKVLGTFEQFAKLERVLGEYGGQLASFESVSRRAARMAGRCRCSTGTPATSIRRWSPTGATTTTSRTG
ncbi:hypothetical protein RLIN73S_05089 [Rhodanobacter lindaniclasticus]